MNLAANFPGSILAADTRSLSYERALLSIFVSLVCESTAAAAFGSAKVWLSLPLSLVH